MRQKLTKLIAKDTMLPLILWSLFFVIIIVGYLANHGLQVYDGAGHVDAVWFLKNYLWPRFLGWNSFNLLGFDQGLSYPMLFHYLAASLAFLLGINFSIYFLIALSLISLPLCVYYFATLFLEEKIARYFLLSFLLIFVIILPGYFGADLKALTQVGLLPSFFSLPLVFLYLSCLPKVEKGQLFWTTLLLASVVLTHLVAGMFVALVLIVFLVVNFFSKKTNKFLIFHIAAGLGLTVFFWGPFLLNYSALSTSAHLSSLGLPNLVIFLISILFTWSYWKKKSYLLVKFSLISLLLSGITFFDYLVERFLNQGFLWEKIYNFHVYRFQIYDYLIFAVLVALYMWTKITYKKFWPIFIYGSFFLALIFLIVKSPFLKTEAVHLNPSFASGRFLESFSRSQVDPFTYTVQTKLVEEKNLPWVYGLFTDATKNGPFLGSLIRSLNPNNYTSTKTSLIENQVLNQEKTAQALDLFGVNNLLEISDSGATSGVASIKYPVNKKTFSLIANNSTSLVEVSPWVIKNVRSDWDKRVGEWWKTPGSFTSLLVENAPVITSQISGDASLKNHNRDWTAFNISIESSTKVPVLVKFTYSKNWHATQSGKGVKIYRASPDLMLVYASGDVRFTYQEPSWPYLLLIFSLLTLICLWRYQKSWRQTSS